MRVKIVLDYETYFVEVPKEHLGIVLTALSSTVRTEVHYADGKELLIIGKQLEPKLSILYDSDFIAQSEVTKSSSEDIPF